MKSVFAILMCISASAFGFWYLSQNRCFIQFALVCSAIIVLSFLLPNIYLFFLFFAAASFFISQTQKDNIYYYYLALLPFFPVSLQLSFGLPGIDTLLTLNHSRVLILCLMGPLLMQLLVSGTSIFDPLKSPTGIVDRLILVHLFFEMIVFFRDFDLLVAARTSLLLLIDFWLPYVIISRYVKNTHVVLIVLLYTACAVAFIALIENKLFFRLYDQISLPLGEKFRIYKIRDGELRASATMANPLSLGFFFSVAVLLAVKVRDLFRCPAYTPWILVAIIAVGIDATGSRSPLFANVFGLAVLFWWSKGRDYVIKTERIAGMLVLAICIWLFMGGLGTVMQLINADGTIAYRYQLILNALHLIKQNFWFGTPPSVFLNDPIMLQSLQGEGIIDLTNTYLVFLLKSGFFSLASFVAIWMVLFHGLCHSAGSEKIAALLMAVSVTIMVMLFITSSVTFVPLYYWLFVGLMSGYIRQNSKYAVSS